MVVGRATRPRRFRTNYLSAITERIIVRTHWARAPMRRCRVEEIFYPYANRCHPHVLLADIEKQYREASEPFGERNSVWAKFFFMPSKKPVARRPPRSATVGSVIYCAPNGLIAKLPFLRFRGRWLVAAGFAIGSAVRIQIFPGELRIRVVHEKASPDRRKEQDS